MSEKPQVPGAVKGQANQGQTANKEAKDPKAPKKPRAPRKDYGWKVGAKITVTEEGKKATYRGKRKEYFERVIANDGKTVEDFVAACPKEDPPRGWLRFFIQDGSVTLSGGKAPEPKPAKKEESEKAA